MRGTMCRGFCVAALASAYICRSSSAALTEVTEVTGVNVTANAWDTRDRGYGCTPAGCVAANVLNDSIADDSRWSCRPSYFEVDVCELTFVFDEPQDIFEVRMAMWKGNERNRTVSFWVDGVLATTVETSADTLEYEAYELSASQVSTIVLQDAGGDPNSWLSITGVQLMTAYNGDESFAGAVPTSGDYVGCYNDLVGDRVLTTVSTDDAMTPAVCEAACSEMSNYYYGLQQGNECWCAGCDITELETNTNYDRHGEGSCSTPCTGDATSACGGDFAISLYQTTTCLATPAPTPAIIASECPSGSTQASLEITGTWDNSYGLDLHVLEPGGVEVYYYNELGDVGNYCEGSYEYGSDGSGSETYLTLNGLNVADDAVLGDYTVWGEGREGTIWSITARSGGELLWTAGGVIGEFESETDRYIATVSSYAESDCTIDDYDKCPRDSYSSDGFPPCTACAEGLLAYRGSIYCTVQALAHLDLTKTISDAIIADAVGGFAGSGRVTLYGGESIYRLFVTAGSESGTISMSGMFERSDDTALPDSIGLYLYLYTEKSPTDFVRGQGVIDAASGNFSATIDDIPVGYSTGLLSFVALDANDGGDLTVGGPVFDMGIANEGCSNELRIKLEWDSDEYLDLWVTDPSGDRVTWRDPATDIGYINDRYTGDYSDVDPDTGLVRSVEEYVLFSGLSGDSMIGDYSVFARRDYAPRASAWILTVTINGEVVSIETGTFDGSSTTWSIDDDTSSRRQLWTDDDYSSYYYTSYPQSDTFIVTVGSYDPAGC